MEKQYTVSAVCSCGSNSLPSDNTAHDCDTNVRIFREYSSDEIRDAEGVVLSKNGGKVTYRYPLSNDQVREYNDGEPWTLYRLLTAIQRTYDELFATDEATASRRDWDSWSGGIYGMWKFKKENLVVLGLSVQEGGYVELVVSEVD